MSRRNSLRDKFGDMGLNEPLTIEIENQELELDVYAGDVSTLMLVGQQDEIGEEHMNKLETTLRKVLQRSYLPYYNKAGDREMEELSPDQEKQQDEEKEFIEGLLSRYFIQLFTEITAELGWHDGDIDASGLEAKKG